MTYSDYSVTIRVLGPLAGGPCQLLPPPQPCPRAAYYAVTATKNDGGSTAGTNVCPDHLFAAIGRFLGLPQGASPHP